MKVLRFGLKKRPVGKSTQLKLKSKFALTPITAEEIIEGAIPGFAYDVVVIGALDASLSSNTLDHLYSFLQAGGSILWIYDQNYYGLEGASWNQVSDFVDVDDIEGFLKTGGSVHELTTGISNLGSAITLGNPNSINTNLGLEFVKRFEEGEEKLYMLAHDFLVTSPYREVQVYKLEDENSSWSHKSTIGTAYYTTPRHAFAAFGSNLYFAQEYYITSGKDRVCYSSNGLSWNYYTMADEDGYTVNYIRSLYATFENKMFMIITFRDIGGTADWKLKIKSTSDGVNWSTEYSKDIVDTDLYNFIWEGHFCEYDSELYLVLGFYQSNWDPTWGWPTPDPEVRILRRSSGGSWSQIHTISSESNPKMGVFKNKLYVGTSPTAKLYSYDGSWTHVHTFSGQANINDLIVMDERLYALVTYEGAPDYYSSSNKPIKLYSSSDGNNWQLDYDIGGNLGYLPWYPTGSDVLCRFRGSLHYSPHIADAASSINMYKSDWLAPVYGDYSRVPTNWTGKGSDEQDPNRGNALYTSWRKDSDWCALLVADETNGRYVFIADSNMFTNNAPHATRGYNQTLMQNILKWVGYESGGTVSYPRILWLTQPDYLNLDSSDDWGSSSIRTYLESLGYIVTLITSEFDSYIYNNL